MKIKYRKYITVLLLVLMLAGCSESNENKDVYNGIKYDYAMMHSHRGGYTIYVIDSDSDKCLKIGKNQISKIIKTEETTYTPGPFGDLIIEDVTMTKYSDKLWKNGSVEYKNISVETAFSYMK